MYGANHAVLGAAGGFLAGTYVEAPFLMRIVMGAIGAFGGLFPDADTKSSMLGRFLPNIWHKLTPGHRGITHSLFYCAIICAIAIGIQWVGVSLGWWHHPPLPYVPIALTVGMLTHLFADSLTVQGVPWFYPFYKRKFRTLGRLSFKTGSEMEPVVVTVLLAIAAAYVLMPFTNGIADTLTLPDVWGVGIERIVMFVVTSIVCGVALTVYSRSRSGGSKKRRKAKTRYS